MHLRLSLSTLLISLFSILTAQEANQEFLSALEYRNVGPNRGGRATAVCGVIGDDQTYYMGATGGGVWKTTDAGISWKNISDGYLTLTSLLEMVFTNRPMPERYGRISD